MRSMWIATGVIIFVLALAAALRPKQRDGAEDGGAGNDRLFAPTELTSRRSLSAEDLDRIIELRAEFGSAADRIGGEKVAPAAFELELRHLAGLSKSSATTETAGDHSQVTATPTDRRAASDATPVFRQAAAALDIAANDAEDAGDYGSADRLRGLGVELRRLARLMDPHE